MIVSKIYILLFIVELGLAVPNLFPNCQMIADHWLQIAHDNKIPPSSHSKQGNNHVCMHASQSIDCCSPQMLSDMIQLSQHEVYSNLPSVFSSYAVHFRNNAVILKTFVTETLGLTMVNLHKKFEADFGYNYEQHKNFFFNFFFTIQSYLFGAEYNLNDMLDNFFDELLLRLTQIKLNLKPNENLSYAKCFSNKLKSKKPFDKVPAVILNMTKEAFPPIRLAINALTVAFETLKTASQPIRISSACTHRHMQLQFCQLCNGFLPITPCDEACNDLSDICTPQQSALSTNWNQFTVALNEALNLLAKFPKVHRPLQMHLTDGIMNLKTVFSYHEQEVFSNCSLETATNHLIPEYTNNKIPTRKVSRSVVKTWQQGFNSNPPQSNLLLIGDQNVRYLDTWVLQMQKKLNLDANLFNRIGQDVCRASSSFRHSSALIESQKPGICWNGTNNVTMTNRPTTKSSHRMVSTLTDVALLEADKRLRQTTENLRLIVRSISDPDIIPTNSQSEMSIKISKNGHTVHSDREALEEYIKPYNLPFPNRNPLYKYQNEFSNQEYTTTQLNQFNHPTTPLVGNNQQQSMRYPYLPVGGNSAFQGGYPLGNEDHSKLPPDDEDRLLETGMEQARVHGLPINQNHFSEQNTFQDYNTLDREQYHTNFDRIDNLQGSGFLPQENYRLDSQPEYKNDHLGNEWPPQSPYDKSPNNLQPIGDWNNEMVNNFENSGNLPPSAWSDPSLESPYRNPPEHMTNGESNPLVDQNQWGTFEKDSVAEIPPVDNTGLSGLFFRSDQKIPNQIWVPDGNGVIRMSISSPITPSFSTGFRGYHTFTYLTLALFLLNCSLYWTNLCSLFL